MTWCGYGTDRHAPPLPWRILSWLPRRKRPTFGRCRRLSWAVILSPFCGSGSRRGHRGTRTLFRCSQIFRRSKGLETSSSNSSSSRSRHSSSNMRSETDATRRRPRAAAAGRCSMISGAAMPPPLLLPGRVSSWHRLIPCRRRRLRGARGLRLAGTRRRTTTAATAAVRRLQAGDAAPVRRRPLLVVFFLGVVARTAASSQAGASSRRPGTRRQQQLQLLSARIMNVRQPAARLRRRCCACGAARREEARAGPPRRPGTCAVTPVGRRLERSNQPANTRTTGNTAPRAAFRARPFRRRAWRLPSVPAAFLALRSTALCALEGD